MNRAFSLVFALVLLIGSFTANAQTPRFQQEYEAADLLAIKPGLRDEIAASLPSGLTSYDIDITIPDGSFVQDPHIQGRQEVTFTNTLDEPMTELPFRLYANGANHNTNAIEITSVSVDGEAVEIALSESDSVAMVTLPAEINPGESIKIEMEFELTVPVNEASHYGILNHNSESETTVLSHWYPVVAGYDPVTGWMLKPTSIFGDPIFTDTAMYDVTITAPAGRTLITSGVETERESTDQTETVHFSAKPSRDFVIVQSETLESVTAEIDGTTVTSWALPQHRAGNKAVLQWTLNSLEVFNPLLGEYPWQNLQVIEAAVFNAAAVELPQMFIMADSYYNAPDLGTAITYFEFTVAHEAVHMWFYSQVGNNQYDDAFIDEGLTNYLSGYIYFRDVYGKDIGDIAFQSFLYRPFERMIEGNADVIVDYPTDNFPSSSAYSSAVYTKAPIGFGAIHQAMGEEPFFAALQNYVHDFRWKVATPPDLEAAFQAETDIDIRELWSRWFERRDGALDIHGAAPAWIA